jgi:ABC-type nitrate/sulfonate/bicarbonate transport system substrate-binding protein
MNRRFRFIFAALLAGVATVLTACSSSGSGGGGGAGSSAPAAGSSAPSGGGIDKAHVVVAWNSTPDEAYLPLLMAIDEMKSKGYSIEAKTLSGSDISFQSLATNRIQFTADSLPPGALSVSQGAPIKLVGARNANLVVWVADKQYQDCSKLSGKPVGIYSQTGGYTVLMKLYFAKHCPGVKPNYVTIPDSPVRAQAVATGRLAGTALGLPDALALQKKYPDKDFYVLPLKEDLPGVGDEYVYTNEQTISSHKAIVEALLTAQLNAIRDIYTDPSSLADLVKKYLPSAADSSVAEQFVQQHIWYANGGLSGPGLVNTLKAFDLPGAPDKLQDTGPLDEVLTKIGKSDATQY